MIESMTTTDQLLQAVGKLPAEDLRQFVQRVIHLEATRRDAPLSATETELLRRINAELPAGKVMRYSELKAKRDSAALTAEETREFLQLSDWLEEAHAERIARVAELAKLRGASLSEVMQQLGLKHLVE